jgi:hypothetical protein
VNSIWQLTGDTWPAWTDLRACKVTSIYFLAMEQVPGGFAPNVRQLDPEYRRLVGTQNMQYRIARDVHWTSVVTPEQVRDHVVADLRAAGTSLAQTPYQIDAEYPYRDPDWLVRAFTLVRQACGAGALSWTMEPGQAQWIGASPKLVKWINNDANFVVCPQNFYGNMQPAPGQVAALRAVGIAKNRVKAMLDAAKPRPAGEWCLFHSGRLVV